jgi:hypothetical protein
MASSVGFLPKINIGLRTQSDRANNESVVLWG